MSFKGHKWKESSKEKMRKRIRKLMKTDCEFTRYLFASRLKGKESPYWKGGRYLDSRGYVRLLVVGTGQYVQEHRVLMEKFIGRKLDINEVVHHKNEIKTDNRLSNLQILDRAEHVRGHAPHKRRRMHCPQCGYKGFSK